MIRRDYFINFEMETQNNQADLAQLMASVRAQKAELEEQLRLLAAQLQLPENEANGAVDEASAIIDENRKF